MARRWFGWCALAAWLVLVIGASVRAAGPHPSASERLEVGALLRPFGEPGDPITGGIWRWRAGEHAGRLFVVTVDTGRARVGILPAREPAPLSSLTAPTKGDFAAINGGFYDADLRPMGLVVSSGVEYARLRRGGGSGVFFVRGGWPGIAHHSDALLRLPLEEAIQSIDRIVDESAPLVNDRPNLPRDARSAVAIDWLGRIHLVAAVDDRAIARETSGRIALGPETTTTGPTLWELADWLARPAADGGLGARAALNLDGGFSTALQLRLGSEEFSLGGYRGTINAVVARPR